MILKTLLLNLPDKNFYYKVYGKLETDINQIVDDSRKVNSRDLFIAIKGLHVDAHDFISEVVKKGVSVVVAEKMPKGFNRQKSVFVKVRNSREALGLFASSWYDNPSKKLKVIGVTGTKGKTTTSILIYHLLNSAEKKVGLVSSISAKIGQREVDTGFHVTSPEPLALHNYLAMMVKNNIDYAVLEVTSHGLDQERFVGINFDIGVLTNISHEHLDYHKTFQAYLFAKNKLFEGVKTAVLNQDDKNFESVKCVVPEDSEVITYGLDNSEADINAVDIKCDAKGCEFNILTYNESVKLEKYYLKTGLIGDYNISNILASIGVARNLGLTWKKIESSVATISQIPGRLENVTNNKGIKIFIDFAHTPNSLQSVLKFLRILTKGKLICVFGCAGERDVLKRPMMGEIACKLADVTIITAEDPRSEDVNTIIAQITEGAKKSGAKEISLNEIAKFDNVRTTYRLFVKVPERGNAITFAITKIAQKDDTVVICGKGHEISMNYTGTEYPWSDHEAVKLALAGLTMAINH